MIKFDKKIRLKYQSLCGLEGYDELRFMRLDCQTSGEGKTVNGERSLKIWEPIDGRELDISFSVFKTCFTDVYISGVEDELIKKNTDDNPQ